MVQILLLATATKLSQPLPNVIPKPFFFKLEEIIKLSKCLHIVPTT